ncbi:hypothetical protein Tco_0722908 [Tanacetum coccineum]
MKSVKKSIDERALHKREYDSRVNERTNADKIGKVDTSKALDASLVATESSGTKSREQDTSSRSGNDAHADDADIRPIYDEEPMAEVQTTAKINVFTIGQQHAEQPEFNNEGEVDHNVEQCHGIRHLPAKLTDNQIIELSNQSLESENICLKKTVAQFQKDFSKLEAHFTTHYLPKERESSFAKPHHVIASSESRNSSKNMSRFSSNDMVYNHYLEEAKKKTHKIGRNSRPSVMPFATSQCTANGSKPKPMINNQKLRNWPASKSSYKCVFNANHDDCVTKFLNEVNSRAEEKQTLDLSAGTSFNRDRIKALIKENVISGRPRLHGIALIQEISSRPSSQGIRNTSSSSIDYIPKSPTSSTSPSPNGYLNPSTSPPPRVSPPPPTQDNASMDITLTLSPNTPLDVQFDTPSPSPPIIAHPIPWNFLEAHGHTSGSGEGKMEHQFELMANVPITPHDSPLPGGDLLGERESDAQLLDPQTKEKSQEIRKTKEVKHLTTKKEEI